MITLVVTEALQAQLQDLVHDSDEAAAVLLVGVGRRGGELRLYGRELHSVEDESYLERTGDALSIASSGWVPALARAAEIGAAALFVHTHPGGTPLPSPHDDLVDEDLRDPFMLRTGMLLYGSLVLAPPVDGEGVSFTGRVWCDADEGLSVGAESISRLLSVGARFRLVAAFDNVESELDTQSYDRHIRAFGGAVQRTLGELRIGIVGAGGTGSAVAEQLVRLGVRHLTIIDADRLSGSNVTRVYGSNPSQVGDDKVDVQRRHLSAVNSAIRLRTGNARTTQERTAALLTGCDVLFGCSDDDAGRLVASRMSTYYLLPVIDCGVLLESSEGDLRGIFGRVTTMVPGQACLVCRGRIDLARAAAELMPPDQLRDRQAEGYAPELHGIEPAVVSYTTLVAAIAVNELLERLIGFGPAKVPSEVLVRVHDREMSTNSRSPNPGHFCDPLSGLLGRADTVPLLDWSWQS